MQCRLEVPSARCERIIVLRGLGGGGPYAERQDDQGERGGRRERLKYR